MRTEAEEELLRRKFSWLALILSILGVGAFLVYCILILARHIWLHPEWLIKIFEAHFQATIGAPLAMVAALVIVTLFRYQSGPIELEAIGFKLKGAAGPVVMWVIVFLAMVIAINLLW